MRIEVTASADVANGHQTIATNGMFRKAYASRRCLVPVDGYFEWQRLDASGKKKQPYAIAMKDGPVRHGRHLGRIFR